MDAQPGPDGGRVPADQEPAGRLAGGGRKFDPDARYIRRWIPELAGDEGVDPHEPGLPGTAVGYPAPVVDLPASRARALDAYASIR